MGIQVRLIAMFDDGELPDGASVIGTLDVPVTCALDEESSDGRWVKVTPDLSIFERLATFLADESDRDPRAVALDEESDRLAIAKAEQARHAVYANPAASTDARVAADRRVEAAKLKTYRRR